MKKFASFLPLNLLAFLMALFLGPFPAHARNQPTADLVIVKKSERLLQLMADGRIIRSFPIALGDNPVGHKFSQGDGRTPEGSYLLDWRNPRSKFYKSIHISYPNPRDLENARRRGLSPGGSIMIHGLPNEYAQVPELFEDLDWTEGCIALANEDIDELWKLVTNNTPIEIYP